eukprot:Nitzschia sp. Nitz4//scaffold3_size479765//111402//113070//NITZ4_000046-RA/size479765-processed-gene-0.63-mRNA-1//1//CDS//3329550596//4660//frame0
MKVDTPQILWNSEGDKGKNAPLYSVALQESGLDEGAHVLVTSGNTNVINLWSVNFETPSFQYMLSLSRHERPVNALAFSPDGLHLVTASESGSLILWSVPVRMRGGGNGRHFWSTITQENELTVRILSTRCEGVTDLSWSRDSKRFVVGTIDSQVLIYQDQSYDFNCVSPETEQKESEWQMAFRNGEHTAFVQGVAYDPLGVYIASMGSDRTVRIYPRKVKSKKKVARPANAPRTLAPPPEHEQLVDRLLTETKLEMGKTKRLQRRSQNVQDTQVKHRLFVDESSCESFFRRLDWTTDGLFLITPCALWHTHESDTAPSFATYLFARHRFDEPYRVLPGLDKPSVVVRPNPVLFALPPQESKENKCHVPYRSVFAVLTLDTVLIYDTYHLQPLAVAKGLHYAGLTDCAWSKDGHHLIVSSSDGYISHLSFAPSELGEKYVNPTTSNVPAPAKVPIRAAEDLPKLPPCQPGPAVLEAPPAKRAKTESTPPASNKSPTSVQEAVHRLSIGESKSPVAKKKAKKRIQPVLVSH